jgi:hypothetical protein
LTAIALTITSAAHASTPHPQKYSFLQQVAAYDADDRPEVKRPFCERIDEAVEILEGKP